MADDYRARLIAAREKLGLTPRQMAERLLTPRQTYEQWEIGARRTPGAAVVAAEALTKLRRAHRPPIEDLTEMRAAGASYRKIADKFGTTPQNIHQMLKSTNAPERPISKRNWPEILALALETGESPKDLAQKMGVTITTIMQAEKRNGMRLRRATRRHISDTTAAILKLDDGTRSAKEIGAILGIGEKAVFNAVWRAKKHQ